MRANLFCIISFLKFLRKQPEGIQESKAGRLPQPTPGSIHHRLAQGT